MKLLKAKAKINLFFHVNNKRSDGYHLIESLVVFAQDIYDSLEISIACTNSTEVIGGEFANLLQNEPHNLIDRVLSSFAGSNKYNCKLTKNIPIGAGLGGGSSDAAIMAKFLNKQQKNINNELTSIGTDLPICYLQQPAFCSNIGEIITEVQSLPRLYLVLVNPRKPLLTKEVFKNNHHLNTPVILNKPLDFQSDTNKLIDFLTPLTNDLTESAIELMPEIKEILVLLKRQNGCKISRMSGSGPTCFAIFTSQELANEAYKNIIDFRPDYWVKSTQI